MNSNPECACDPWSLTGLPRSTRAELVRYALDSGLLADESGIQESAEAGLALRIVAPDPPLTDGTIVLRMRRASDVPLIAAASRDPETRRRLDDEPLTREQQRTSVERARGRWESGTAAPFVIADAQAAHRPLGLLNVRLADDEAAGVAVSVFPEARGAGVAPRALRLAAEWCVRELGLQRVFAEAAADNRASIRAIEKAGFVREGLLRAHCATHGRRHDCVMFSLLPGDVRPRA